MFYKNPLLLLHFLLIVIKRIRNIQAKRDAVGQMLRRVRITIYKRNKRNKDMDEGGNIATLLYFRIKKAGKTGSDVNKVLRKNKAILF